MTAVFENPTALLVLALIGIILFGASLGWFSPGLSTNFSPHPTNDCGQNYHLRLEHPGGDICLITTSEKEVNHIAQGFREEMGTQQPDEIWLESPLDRALQWIEKFCGF